MVDVRIYDDVLRILNEDNSNVRNPRVLSLGYYRLVS